MAKHVIAIPDIHGQIDNLNSILELIERNYKDYKIVFLGDYVDRGNDGCKVLRKVKEMTDIGHVALMGNHEEFFLEWMMTGGEWYFEPLYGGLETIKSFEREAGKNFSNHNDLWQYLGNDKLLVWLAQLPAHHTEGKLSFTHAPVPIWNGMNPISESHAKHNFPASDKIADMSQALQAPQGYYAVCGHVSIDKPLITPNGMYLDCGCGKIGKSLKAAVFKDNKLLKVLDSKNV